MAKQKKTKKKKKVAIYIRVSTVEQSDNDFSSLDGQENQCKALTINRNELKDEIEFCQREKKRLSNRKTVNTNSYKKILKQFIKSWKDGDPNEREDHVKALLRKVISNVNKDKTGTIEVEYIADKKLEAEWKNIKKCESGSRKSLEVRTLDFDGSPGRTCPPNG